MKKLFKSILLITISLTAIASSSYFGDGRLIENGSVQTWWSPRSIVVDPSGKYAYVFNRNSRFLLMYVINSDGKLIANGMITQPDANTYSAAIDPSGRYIYVAYNYRDSISMYKIGGDGKLIENGMLSVGIKGDFNIRVDPSGKFVYVTAHYIDNGRSRNKMLMYKIGSDGKLIENGIIDWGIYDGSYSALTVHPSGKYVYVAKNYVNGTDKNKILMYKIGSDGKLTENGSIDGISGDYYGLITIDPSGKHVYVDHSNWCKSTVSLYKVDSNGKLTENGDVARANDCYSSITIDPSGKYAYTVTNIADISSSIFMYKVSGDGKLIENGSISSYAYSYSLVVDPSGKYVYLANRYADVILMYKITTQQKLNETVK